MSTEDKKTDNELIAEFMGGKMYKEKKFSHCFEIAPQDLPVAVVVGYLTIDELRYDKSWDWIMHVVKRITITKPMNQAWFDVGSPLTRGDLYGVNQFVIRFILWYNTQPK